MLSRELEETLRRAMSNAATRSHEFATLEHLLLALTEDSDALEVLRACNVDIEKLAAKLGEFIEIELASIVDPNGNVDVQRDYGMDFTQTIIDLRTCRSNLYGWINQTGRSNKLLSDLRLMLFFIHTRGG